MTDKEHPAFAPERENKSNNDLMAIDVVGKDLNTWKKHNSKFYDRLKNSVETVFSGNIPIMAEKIKKEITDFVNEATASAHEKLKNPKLINTERQASIEVKLAEKKERNAKARLTNLEADKQQIENERERIFESEKIIFIMQQRGEVTIEEKQGQLFVIYKK